MPESDSKPCVYIFHGDDPVALERAVADLLAKMGEPGIAELNTSRLDGRTLSDEDLRTAVMAIPFLSERRLVILRNPLARIDKRNTSAQDRFKSLLDQVPESTRLVLVVEDELDRGKWTILPPDVWLMNWQGQAGKRVYYRLFQLPTAREMPDWVNRQAREMGGVFTVTAARGLVELVGNDTQIAAQEIRKLLEYVNYQRAVEQEDVEHVAAAMEQVNIFEMTDALAEGNATKAQRLLQILLQDSEVQSVFPMVVRQFRLLIMAREALDDGIPAQRVGEVIGQKSSYVVDKVVRQAGRFTLPRLELLYHRLLEIDEAAKTSAMPLETALALLIVEV